MLKIGRRLVALLLVGASALASAKDPQPSAIVVGGGLAGLTAAFELQQRGWNVTLLEAKPSVGGRASLAATEWIGSAKLQPQLNHYLQGFKLQTVPAPGYVRQIGYLVDGQYYSVDELAKAQPTTGSRDASQIAPPSSS